MIRPAVPDDIDAVVRLGLLGLESDPYPGLLIDKDKVRAAALDVVSSPANFCWVNEIDGEVVAVVSALVHDMMFHQRKQATVIQFWSTKPRAGLPLIVEFLKWARARRAIKSIVFTVEAGADPRIGKLLRRMGLRQELPVYMETR